MARNQMGSEVTNGRAVVGVSPQVLERKKKLRRRHGSKVEKSIPELSIAFQPESKVTP